MLSTEVAKERLTKKAAYPVDWHSMVADSFSPTRFTTAVVRDGKVASATKFHNPNGIQDTRLGAFHNKPSVCFSGDLLLRFY